MDYKEIKDLLINSRSIKNGDGVYEFKYLDKYIPVNKDETIISLIHLIHDMRLEIGQLYALVDNLTDYKKDYKKNIEPKIFNAIDRVNNELPNLDQRVRDIENELFSEVN